MAAAKLICLSQIERDWPGRDVELRNRDATSGTGLNVALHSAGRPAYRFAGGNLKHLQSSQADVCRGFGRDGELGLQLKRLYKEQRDRELIRTITLSSSR